MRCLIVLSLLCIAAVNAYTDDDLMDKLLKRYEEKQKREQEEVLTLFERCERQVSANFDYYVNKDDEGSYADEDMATMVVDCVYCQSIALTSDSLVHCTEKLAATYQAPPSTRRALFGRDQPVGNCHAAAEDLNQLSGGTPTAEVEMEEICNGMGGVHKTLDHLSVCVKKRCGDRLGLI